MKGNGKSLLIVMAPKFTCLLVFLIIPVFFCFYQIAEAGDSGLKKIETNGYIEAYFFPPHNEYDPNLGVDFQDRVVARYGLELYTEIIHRNFPRFYLFAHPFIFFGDSRPQHSYNYKADPIAIQIKHGAGYKIVENLEARITLNGWYDLGGYKGEQNFWNSISVRYKW